MESKDNNLDSHYYYFDSRHHRGFHLDRVVRIGWTVILVLGYQPRECFLDRAGFSWAHGVRYGMTRIQEYTGWLKSEGMDCYSVFGWVPGRRNVWAGVVEIGVA